jgi:hypothetical protein
MRLLNNDQQLRRWMGTKARELILREYRRSHKGRKFMELYADLAAR